MEKDKSDLSLIDVAYEIKDNTNKHGLNRLRLRPIQSMWHALMMHFRAEEIINEEEQNDPELRNN